MSAIALFSIRLFQSALEGMRTSDFQGSVLAKFRLLPSRKRLLDLRCKCHLPSVQWPLSIELHIIMPTQRP